MPKADNPFRYFNSSPEVIRLVVMMYVKFPLSLRNVEDLLAERGIDVSYETIRFWWNRFGPMFAAERQVAVSLTAPRGDLPKVRQSPPIFPRLMAVQSAPVSHISSARQVEISNSESL